MGKLYKTILCTKASISDVDAAEIDLTKLPAKTKACDMEYELDRDLMKIISVLLSVGMNKNDDVFLAEEVLPARSTGAHKPVNVEHDRTRIVGHMLQTYVTNKDGYRIPEEDLINMPDDFDITNEAVLYKFLLPEIAEDVLSEASMGELFVSVEAWFTDYDYLVGDKIIKRNDKTSSVLEDILRANGGDGYYRGHKVGRVLRNILIGGVGLTSKPANPESVIRSISSEKVFDVKSMEQEMASHVLGSVNKDIVMSEKKDQKLTDEMTNEIKNVVAFIKRQYEDQIAQMKSKADEYEASLSNLQIQLNEIIADRDLWKGKMEEIEMDKVTEDRRKVLANIFRPEFVNDRLEQYKNLTDDEFSKKVEELKSLSSYLISTNNEEPKGGEADNGKETEEKKEEVVEEPKEPEPSVEESAPVSAPEPEPEPVVETDEESVTTPVETKEEEPKSEETLEKRVITVQEPPKVPTAPQPIKEIKLETDVEREEIPCTKIGIPTETPTETKTEEKPAETEVKTKTEEPKTEQDKEPRLEKQSPVEETPSPAPEENDDIDLDAVEPVDIDVIPETDDKKDSLPDSFRAIVDKIKLGWQRPTI